MLVVQFGWLAGLVALVILVAQPAQAQSFLAIEKDPPVVRKHFAVAPPVRPDSRLGMDDAGTTFWAFNIKPVLDGDVVSAAQFGNIWRANVSIVRTTVKVGLIIDTFLGEHPQTGAIEYKDGYDLICQRLYKDAETTINSLVQSLSLQPASATGPTRDAAIENAIAAATKGLTVSYYINTTSKAQRIGRAYDLISLRKGLTLTEMIDRSFHVADINPQAFNHPDKSKLLMRTAGSIK